MKRDEKVNVSVIIEPDLLTKVDKRAESLDMNRSQYLRRLVKQDLGFGVPQFEPVKEKVAA